MSRAHQIARALMYRAAKPVDTSRVSTTVLADDPHLVLTLPTGRYDLKTWLKFRNVTTVTQGLQFQLQLIVGSLAVGSRLMGIEMFGVLPTLISIGIPQVVASAPNAADVDRWTTLDGIIQVLGDTTLAIQWAQNVSNANATVMKDGSFIRAIKMD